MKIEVLLFINGILKKSQIIKEPKAFLCKVYKSKGYNEEAIKLCIKSDLNMLKSNHPVYIDNNTNRLEIIKHS